MFNYILQFFVSRNPEKNEGGENCITITVFILFLVKIMRVLL